MLKAASIFLLICSVVVLQSCRDKFDEVDASVFQAKLNEAFSNTAVSWWYLGEENGYYYFLEKWPLEQFGYKVSKQNLIIKVDPPLELTFDKDKWVNLKVWLVEFQKTE